MSGPSPAKPGPELGLRWAWCLNWPRAGPELACLSLSLSQPELSMSQSWAWVELTWGWPEADLGWGWPGLWLWTLTWTLDFWPELWTSSLNSELWTLPTPFSPFENLDCAWNEAWNESNLSSGLNLAWI